MDKKSNFLKTSFGGFFMALADSVPGVSGGTIAFILGFYDEFVNSLHNIVFGSKEEKKNAVRFLIKLIIGWIVGFGIASVVLSSLFETQIYKVSSVFMGFIIFSIPLIIKEEKECLKGKYLNIAFTILGILIVGLITYFNPVTGGKVVDVSSLNILLCLYIVVVAMIAISAMIVPGISGSTLLLIFGLYIPIMSSVKEVIKFNFSALPILLLYLLGVVVGVLLTIKIINKALQKYRSQTIYLILGLMIGSIYAIGMGPTTLDIPQDPMSLKTFSILFFILGGAVILGLEKMKNVLDKNN